MKVVTSDIYILGGYQSDFARNYVKQGLEVSDIVSEVLTQTWVDSQIEPSDIETIHVANAFGQLFNGQGQLGGMPATVEPNSGGFRHHVTRLLVHQAESRFWRRWPISKLVVTSVH